MEELCQAGMCAWTRGTVFRMVRHDIRGGRKLSVIAWQEPAEAQGLTPRTLFGQLSVRHT